MYRSSKDAAVQQVADVFINAWYSEQQGIDEAVTYPC